MRYASARCDQAGLDGAYRVYVSDCLRQLTENTATFEGSVYIVDRFADMVAEIERPTPKKSADEIIADLVDRAGLEVTTGGSV